MLRHGLRGVNCPLLCALGICAAFTIGVTCPQGTAQAKTGDEFCAGGIVRDYARPLKRLPKIHVLPASGALPFGPDWLHVEKYPMPVMGGYRDPYFGHVLLPGANKFGYVLQDQGNASIGVELDWTVTARMLVTTRSGLIGREVALQRFQIGNVGRGYWRRLVVSALRRPGLYRFDIQFRTRFGRILGRFQEYLRVVHPRYEARLVIDNPILRRGESAAIRIDNVGTKSITFEEGFSFGFRLQRFDGLNWVEVTLPTWQGWRIESNRIAGFPNLYRGVPAGWNTSCIGSIQISPEFEAGLYRILKPVKISRRHGLGPPINLAAEFQVVE
jgi:hypothetical protein